MQSPWGSSLLANCSCHGGTTVNGTTAEGTTVDGTTCTVCPVGSWCPSATGVQTCPNGTTSNVASRKEEDCYCLDGYHGSIDCATRKNVTHAQCEPGYAYESHTDIIRCRVCETGTFCDGADRYPCPVGMFSPFGSSDIDDCTCDADYTRAECSSTVSFTVSLAMTSAEFTTIKQGEYKESVATAIGIPETSVVIVSIVEIQALRRLLSSSIAVETSATVPGVNAQAVSNAASSGSITTQLASAGMTATGVSKPTIVDTSTPTPSAGITAVQIILIVTASVLFSTCCVVSCIFTCNQQEYEKVAR